MVRPVRKKTTPNQLKSRAVRFVRDDENITKGSAKVSDKQYPLPRA